MENFLNPLRLRAIFGQDTPEQPNPNIMGQPSNQGLFQPIDDINQGSEHIRRASMNELEPQNDEAMRQFLASLSQMPQREDPSIWRRIGAGIVGAGRGMQAGNEFIDRPYTNQVKDWTLKNTGLGRAAEIERLNNAQISRDEYNNVLNQTRIGDLNRKIDADESRFNQGQQRIDQGNAKLKLEQFKIEHPDYDLKQIPGGNWVFFNPKNPTEAPIDTGINAGTLSQADAINMRGQWAMRAAAVPRTVNSSSTTTTVTPEKVDIPSPNEQKVGEYLRARELYNDPQLKPYIVLGDPGTNDFTIDPKTPPEIQKVIRDRIYPRGDIQLPGPGVERTTSTDRSSVSAKGNTPPKTNTPKAPVAPKGWKYVPKAGGGWTAVEDK